MMKKQDVRVGGTYLAKVGARSVEVRIEGETPKGAWNAVSLASGKPIRVKDPGHLRPVKDAGGGDDGATVATGDAEVGVAQPPPDDADRVPLTQLNREKKHAGTKAKAAKAPKEKAPKKPAPQEAPRERKPKGMSALDAAAAVLKAKGQPMRCLDLIAEMKQQGLWESAAPTPAATLSSALLREITAKGAASRFMKADRGLFALRGH